MSSLLPSNSTAAERALAEAMAAIDSIPVPVRDVWNADTIPAPYLAWLAWAYSVDEWNVNWSENQKRTTVKRALAIQWQKGTIGAVREALGALGISVQVQEWFQQSPQGAPYTFRLYVQADQTPVPLIGLNAVHAVVNSAKNLRSHLDEISLQVRSRSTAYVGVAINAGHEITLTNFLKPADAPFIAASAQLDTIITTYMANHLGAA